MLGALGLGVMVGLSVWWKGKFGVWSGGLDDDGSSAAGLVVR